MISPRRVYQHNQHAPLACEFHPPVQQLGRAMSFKIGCVLPTGRSTTLGALSVTPSLLEKCQPQLVYLHDQFYMSSFITALQATHLSTAKLAPHFTSVLLTLSTHYCLMHPPGLKYALNTFLLSYLGPVFQVLLLPHHFQLPFPARQASKFNFLYLLP